MSDITTQRLHDALERLLAGEPIHTKSDGKISIKRINDEAKLSQGAIYYYKDFIKHAKAKIEQYKADGQPNIKYPNEQKTISKDKKLRNEREHEKRLKNEYREQVNNLKQLTDEVVKQNVSLAFRVLELENDIRRRADENIIDFNKVKE